MHKEQTLLWEMLSALSTEQLDAHLALELEKEHPDEVAVQTILAVLRMREKDISVELTPNIHAAWEKYQKDTESIPKENRKHIPPWLVRVASLGVVVVLLFTMIPTSVQADNFWNRIARWTSDIFEFFSPYGNETVPEVYVFKTDNPGLQQIHDAALGIGIAEPVVPMWLPEGYILTEIHAAKEIEYSYIHARLSNGDTYVIVEIRKYNTIVPGQYEKDSDGVEIIELQGIKHYIIRNIENCTAAWTKDSLECCIAVDDQEDIIYSILRSIYTLEEKK